ncbi:MAG: fumarylacetoacetate hydrolase family protein [Alphaproteobacteria bacterium]
MFALATVTSTGSPPFVVMVLGARALSLAALYAHYCRVRAERAKRLTGSESMLGLLLDWDANFETLADMAAFAKNETIGDREGRFAELRKLPPILAPGKMFYAAQNYKEHVKEMQAAKFASASKDFSGERDNAKPYAFLRAPSTLLGACDDIVLPAMFDRIDWEVEMAVVIGRRGKHIAANRAKQHIAGFMTANDVSCRSLFLREDRPALRSDWLGGKNHDTFGPMGPFFVPREFVANYMTLRLTLSVNGEVMQDGRTSEMIFAPEEQIEYCSHFMTLEPGDVFATGTPSGVGTARGKFLKAGDVVEAEVEGLGRQRNRVVAESAAGVGA